MKNDTFVVKEQYQFPKGVDLGTRRAVTKYWKETRDVDLTKPQYTIYSRRAQEKERKQKTALDRRTVKAKNGNEYYKNANKLRAQGYDYSSPGFTTGDWKAILEKEKILKSMGRKTKVSFYKGWYTLWVK